MDQRRAKKDLLRVSKRHVRRLCKADTEKIRDALLERSHHDVATTSAITCKAETSHKEESAIRRNMQEFNTEKNMKDTYTERINTFTSSDEDAEDLNNTESAVNSYTEKTNDTTDENFQANLIEWAISHQIQHNSMNALLALLKKHECYTDLLSNVRTLRKTPRITRTRSIPPGGYYRFELQKVMKRFLEEMSQDNSIIDCVKIAVNIDGIPLSTVDPFYAVVEFTEGLQIIPSNWLNETMTESFWPSFTNISRYPKAIQRMDPPQSSWTSHPIVKILATTSNYEKAKKTLADTQILSDLTSDSNAENLFKKSRKERGRIVFSSDEERSAEELEVIVPFSNIPKRQCTELQSKTYKKSTVTHELTREDPSTSQEANANLIQTSKPADNRANCTKDFQQFIVRKLTDMDLRVRAIENMQQEISKKVNFDTADSPSEEINIVQFLPLCTNEDLTSFEIKLKEKTVRNSLVSHCMRLGGNIVNTTAYEILRALLSNDLACQFSWHGRKGKSAFENLEISTVIRYVLWKRFPSHTEKDLVAPIKSWLAHAPERIRKATH